MLGIIWGALQHVIIDNALMVGSVAAGVAVALLAPQRFKDYGVAVAALALVAFLIFNDGVAKGKADVQVQWDQAVAATRAAGEKARADAERAIPTIAAPPVVVVPVPAPLSRPTVAARGKSSGVSNPCKPLSTYDRCR